jgi:hypothetical protein
LFCPNTSTEQHFATSSHGSESNSLFHARWERKNYVTFQNTQCILQFTYPAVVYQDPQVWLNGPLGSKYFPRYHYALAHNFSP